MTVRYCTDIIFVLKIKCLNLLLCSCWLYVYVCVKMHSMIMNAKRGLIRAFINTEKSRFEILITVYLDNAWCLVYQLLHQSIVIQGNSAGALFDGLLAELPAILDSFFTSTTSKYIGVVGRGWWGATKWRGKHTLCSYTCFMDPLVLELAQKVVKSVDNITTRSCETSQPGSLC